jgi:hypothetical protein
LVELVVVPYNVRVMEIGHFSKRKKGPGLLCAEGLEYGYFYRFSRRIALWVVGAQSVSLSPGFLPRGNEKQNLAEYLLSSLAHSRCKMFASHIGPTYGRFVQPKGMGNKIYGPFNTHKLGCPSIFRFAIIFKVSLKTYLGT